MEIGAQAHGHWSGAHACAWDYNATRYGNRKLTDLYQKHSYPYALIVNINGDRFVDEGADYRNYTYAKYGREILKQPQRAAFQLFDQKTVPLQRDEYRIREVIRRRKPDASRERSAVRVQLELDGAMMVDEVVAPGGLKRDGAASAYRRMVIGAGRPHIYDARP